MDGDSVRKGPWVKGAAIKVDRFRGKKRRKGQSHVPKGYEEAHAARLAAETERIQGQLAKMSKAEIDSRGQ